MMERKMIDGLRYYMVEGTACPSVTSILKYLPEPEQLTNWKNNNTDWPTMLKRAALAGTIAHYRIAEYFAQNHGLPRVHLEVDDEAPPLDAEIIENVKKAYAVFEELVGQYQMVPFDIETATWHTRAMYAGTVDFLGTFAGQNALIDFKTSKFVSDSHRAQVVAYKRAILSHDKPAFEPEIAVVIAVSPKTGLHVEIIDDEYKWESLFFEAFDKFQKNNRTQDRWIRKGAL